VSLFALLALCASQDVRPIQIQAQAQASARTLELYEVSDILRELSVGEADPNSAEAEEEPQASSIWLADKFSDRRGSRSAPMRRAQEHLSELLRAFVTPQLDSSKDTLQVASFGTLAVQATPEQQKGIADFLLRQREPAPQVRVGMQALEVPTGGFQRLGLQSSSAMFDEPQREAFVKRLIESGANVVTSPKLQVNCRQRANLAAMEQIGYIKEWRLQIIEPGHQEIADPIVEVALEGFNIDLFAVPLDPQSFGIEVNLVRSQIQRPIPTKQVRIAANRDQMVEIGMPEVTKITLTARVRLSQGASAIFMTPGKDGRDLGVVVTLEEVLRPSEARALGERVDHLRQK
jgi:hypothetical protein